MAHYLVTGAAGFIASRVITLLVKQGHAVTGIDNINDAYDVRLKQWRLAQLNALSGFTFHKLDIEDRPALEALWRTTDPFDGVVNLAARAGVRQSVANPWVYQTTNTMGTLNLLDLCRSSNVRKFILASTSSLYGSRNPMPFREDADTNMPLSPYAASKKGAEVIAFTYHFLYKIDVTVFRYFTVYGPAGRPDMSLFRFVQWVSEGRTVTIFGDGKQSRDFTYVDDIARGTVLGLSSFAGYQTINLGSNKPHVLTDVLHLVEELVGKRATVEHKPFPTSDVMATWADVALAREELGWMPQTSIEEGVRNLVDWYRDNQSWACEIRTD